VADAVNIIMMGRLLNTFLREVGGARPADPDRLDGLPERLRGTPLELELPRTGRSVVVAVGRSSPSGHHELLPPMFFRSRRGEWTEGKEPLALATALIEELVAGQVDAGSGQDRGAGLLSDVASSIESTRLFAAARDLRARAWWTHEGVSRFIGAEQSLVFGHPFHPAPKGSEPRLADDLSRYRPELGASFQLHYLALAPDLLLEKKLSGVTELLPAAAAAEATHRLPATRQGWPLLPCHPWQLECLMRRPEVTTLVRQGRLIPLGPLGEQVVPTSSVRTVYLPGPDRFFKLPLDARITNFVRNNPLAHLERSLAASRVCRTVSPGLPDNQLAILSELGYRGLSPAGWPDGSADGLLAGMAVLFRQGILDDGLAPTVVAALVEPAPANGEAPVGQLLWIAARARRRPLTAAFVCEWLRRYLELSMLPLLWLFVHRGVSLEAHVQNSLLAVEDGWPVRFYVRDLEGTSISRQRAVELAFFGNTLPAASTVLLDDSEAWQRLLYYFFVNHLAHLIATLAASAPAEEWQLWQVVRGLLQDATALRSGRGAQYLDELLSRPDLPAKANLLSCFEGCGEKPRYVAIPNPLRGERWTS
jgi:L-2,3-diaminopropanoate---citrate ligase